MISIMSYLFSVCCQWLQIVVFVCLNAPFDNPVHPFVLFLHLFFCSSCLAVVYRCHLCFSLLNLLQHLCGNPPLVVGVPWTQHFIAYMLMWLLFSISVTLCWWFPLPSALSGCGTYCRAWCWIPPVCSLRRNVLYPQALVCHSLSSSSSVQDPT